MSLDTGLDPFQYRDRRMTACEETYVVPEVGSNDGAKYCPVVNVFCPEIVWIPSVVAMLDGSAVSAVLKVPSPARNVDPLRVPVALIFAMPKDESGTTGADENVLTPPTV